ncbi:MAG: DUF366 family protein [candidate division WOR-3 bacterium]|nr:MAG: DUF366 family protein [candidate division WOR-3 bacterium]
MKYHVAKDRLAYTGEQLRSNFAYLLFGVIGDSIVAFGGPCDVKQTEMVDIEDLKAENRIYSDNMLHFIVEHHDTDLEKGVLRQLLLVNIVKDLLNEQLGDRVVSRSHTDLFDGDSKLSISVATVTPVSSVIHFGINVSSLNTPVKTKGLADYSIEPLTFADRVVRKYVEEVDKIYKTRCKVKWVE